MAADQIQALRLKLQAACGPNRSLDAEIGRALGFATGLGASRRYGNAPQAFTRGLEQALWVKNTIFPGVAWTLNGDFNKNRISALLWFDRFDYDGDGATAALALLDAILHSITMHELPAQGIEVRRTETGTGSARESPSA